MPWTKPVSLSDDRTKRSYIEGQVDGKKEKKLETSLEVQPDEMMGKHLDGKHNPLERPQVSEKVENVVADGTSHAGQGEHFFFQAEVAMDLQTSQVAARRFVLPIDR